jgi:hypothetical protein
MSLKFGGLHEKHAVATWNLETTQHLLEDRKKENLCRDDLVAEAHVNNI